MSRVSLSLAVSTGLPPTVDEGLDCAVLPLPLVEALPLKVLSCFGLVVKLTTPPRPTFLITFLLDEDKFLVGRAGDSCDLVIEQVSCQ